MTGEYEDVQAEVNGVDAVEAGDGVNIGDDWKTALLATKGGYNWLGAKSYRADHFGRLSYQEMATEVVSGRKGKTGGEYHLSAICFGLGAIPEGTKPRMLSAERVAIYIDDGGWRVYTHDEMIAAAIQYIAEHGYPTIDNQHNAFIGPVRPGGPIVVRPAFCHLSPE